jgi:hypothetical protein
MAKLSLNLHPAQRMIWDDPARFKFVRAGRRFGKTNLAAARLSLKGLTATAGVGFYVAPTFQQAKDLMWTPLKQHLKPFGAVFKENTGVVELPNGNVIMLKGSDRPDTLRGNKLFDCVIDEYADMKPDVFEAIIRPSLSDLKAGALIIGTPKGRDHMYNLEQAVLDDPEWSVYHFTTYDNPFIDPAEIDAARRMLSTYFFKQEYLAEYAVSESDLFKADWIRESSVEPKQGEHLITVDLAGFTDFEQKIRRNTPNLDDTAIATTKVNGVDWWVKQIEGGRWTTAETAKRIITAAKDVEARTIGIEKGALFQAIWTPLQTEMRDQQYFARILDLTHNNTKKIDRVLWALQGKLEHGRIKFNPGPYLDKFKDQLFNMPSRATHDDYPDALSLVAQLTNDGVGSIDPNDMITDYFEARDE